MESIGTMEYCKLECQAYLLIEICFCWLTDLLFAIHCRLQSSTGNDWQTGSGYGTYIHSTHAEVFFPWRSECHTAIPKYLFQGVHFMGAKYNVTSLLFDAYRTLQCAVSNISSTSGRIRSLKRRELWANIMEYGKYVVKVDILHLRQAFHFRSVCEIHLPMCTVSSHTCISTFTREPIGLHLLLHSVFYVEG